MPSKWKEVESNSKLNTAITAGASEQINATTQRVDYYNKLIVINRDVVDIRVHLGGLQLGSTLTSSAGKSFEVPASNVGTIEPEEGIHFVLIDQQNLHASTTEVADKITFRWARAVEVG